MNNWSLFFIIALVLGVIVSNLLILKTSAKMKLSDKVFKSIKEKKKNDKNVMENSK